MSRIRPQNAGDNDRSGYIHPGQHTTPDVPAIPATSIIISIIAVGILAVALLSMPGSGSSRSSIAVAAPIAAAPDVPVGITPTSTCSPEWDTVASPNVAGEYNNLEGVGAVSSNDVWAVGYHSNLPLIEHWDGRQWSIQPQGICCGFLMDLSVITANDIWAVGPLPGGGQGGTFTMHWNGTTWSQIPSPQFSLGARLDGVAAVAPSDVWAVGYYNVPGINSETLVIHWDGFQWSVVSSPNVSGSNSYLQDIAAISTNDVWAVGYCYVCQGLGYGTLTMHWDGSNWQVVDSPNPGRWNQLLGVAAISTNDVWAVGGNEAGTLTMHWNGSKWSIVPQPRLPNTSLAAVTARSTNDVWAVGEGGSHVSTVVLHWNGSEWSIVPSPSPGGGGNWLYGVVPISDNEAWAVGNQYSSYYNTLIEHYSDPCSTPSPTPSPSPGITSTPGISPTSAPTFTSTPTVVATATTATPAATSTPTTVATAIATGTGTGTATVTATVTSTPCLIAFTDVHPSDYFYTAVTYLSCHGIISGYADGTFRPYNNTTRGQVSKIIVLAEGFTLACPTQHFTDVPPSDAFYCYIETAYGLGIVSGYADGTFRPGNDVTRGQQCKMVVIAAAWTSNCPPPGHFTDVPPTHPFFCYIETAYSHGIISGYSDGTFQPGNSATRGQISKIVYQAITGP